ncbi:protein ALTERED PHOSPHATE STARVATION RESPONSE 1-like [Phragmites australis]|uniref:protein ALTERED PHOSPHATE STARVATION RESPONSE 1-like n=1 Tax=Phragmites australis TaxID=29695 RepID=UPI002D7676DA|nr:protein ALTERED PHOSPHATE STARVATION RESPONSE 1-like [Phragmites australis]
MGCKGSKLDEQEAVALCRGRADLLAAAVRHRYALADAHAALADSLASVAEALHLLMTASASTLPRLALPTSRKGVDAPPRQQPSSPPHSSSHINFAPSSESESESGSVASSPHRCAGHDQLHHPHPHPDRLPFPHYGYNGYGYAPEPPFGGYPPGSLRLYYARNRPPQASVAVEQRTAAPERVYYGSFEPAAGGYPQHYSYGSEPPTPGRDSEPPTPGRAAAPPPSASSWDFFNVFDDYDVYDNYCYDAVGGGATAVPAYTPSRSSREVREEEGIPELEEDEVVVKQVDSEYSTPGSGARSRRSSLSGVSSSIAEVDEVENSVVDKEVIGGGNLARQQAGAQRNVTASAPTIRRAIENTDVAGEIKTQFVRASDAVRALAPILEVGRQRYHPRSSVYHVSSQMVSAIALPHSDLGGVELLDVGGEKVVGGRSLSLTLQKLYIWEKKLYEEVKAEEKMRLLLAKNSKRLKFLDQKGAEAHKIDMTRNLVRKLSTKIRIAVRVIAKVSKKISRVRDDELCPQINALIQGFVRMWHDKLDCYLIQCQVMSEAKNLDSIVSGGSSRDLALELELELIKWIVKFSYWVNAQRCFVKALNGWLALCLNYKVEETVDGVPPYSPGKVGAPLVFVICNSWSQAMDRISEKEVVTSMQALVSNVRKLSEQHNVEQTEQIIASRERDKWNKTLERKTQEINKEADALNRKLALVPGWQSLLPSAHTYQEHLLEASNLQTCLGRVVQALESFASSSLKVFEETLRHAEEERLSREGAKVS